MDGLATKKRIEILDVLRGVLIILVVLYHLFYDLDGIFGVELPFFRTGWFESFRKCFVGMLILIAGISCNLSRSNIRRGVRTLLCGMVITAVTFVFMPRERIVFGVLHFFGVSMILYGLLEKVICRIPMWLGFVASLLLFLLTRNLYYGFFGIGSMGIRFSLTFENLVTFILGFPAEIYSSDYYPIMPWFFLFLAGGFLGRDIKKRNLPAVCHDCGLKWLQFIGRHTLMIYMVHQPLIYGILSLIFMPE